MRPADDQHEAARAVDPAARAAARAVPGAGGVVFDRHGRVLVLRHANGDWVFPKGHVEGSETLLEAALREVLEESGVVATCPDPGRSWTTSYRNAHGAKRHITWFACATEASAPKLTEDLFPEGLFLPPDVAQRQLTYDADRALLAQVVAAGGPRAEGGTR